MSESIELSGEGYTVRLQETPISLPLNIPEGSGGRVTFSGVVRPTEDGRDIDFLSYDAYSDMAIKNLENIAREALLLYKPLYIYAIHRIGTVKVGDASVVVDVFSEHRTEGFKACSLVIDRIKQEVPIWKKVIYSDGSQKWKDELDRDLEKAP